MTANDEFRPLVDHEIDQIFGGDSNANVGAAVAGVAVAVAAGFLVAGTGGVALVVIGAAVAIGAATRQTS